MDVAFWCDKYVDCILTTSDREVTYMHTYGRYMYGVTWRDTAVAWRGIHYVTWQLE